MNYSEQFYADRKALTQTSANAVLDVLFTHVTANRVLDVGCATGIWLAACKTKGCSEVHGVDGPWVPRERLDIAEIEFTEHVLGDSMPEITESFDLALCIEVAEHLEAAAATSLVSYLTSRADVVLFSAAIPGQGGTGHINEQPQSYWRDHFATMGFVCLDLIRPALWSETNVNLIYRQNMLVYVREGSAMEGTLTGQGALAIASDYELDRVHPELLARRMRQRTLRALLRQAVYDCTIGLFKRRSG